MATSFTFKRLQRDINKLLDSMPPQYKVLVVVQDPNTDEGMMTNTCCDGCGFLLASRAADNYLRRMTPEHRGRAQRAARSLVELDEAVEEVMDRVIGPPDKPALPAPDTGNVFDLPMRKLQ